MLVGAGLFIPFLCVIMKKERKIRKKDHGKRRKWTKSVRENTRKGKISELDTNPSSTGDVSVPDLHS